MYGESGVCRRYCQSAACCICEFLQREIEIEISIRPCGMLHMKFTEYIYNYIERLDNVGTIAKTISYFVCKSLF